MLSHRKDLKNSSNGLYSPIQICIAMTSFKKNSFQRLKGASNYLIQNAMKAFFERSSIAFCQGFKIDYGFLQQCTEIMPQN